MSSFFPAVPSKAPPNIQVDATSSTSISVTWKPIAQAYVHGILLGYNVSYAKEDVTPLSWENKFLPPDTHSVHLNELRKYVRYVVKVCAATSKGCGTAEQFHVRTHPDSK